jgi:hypothetical protein
MKPLSGQGGLLLYLDFDGVLHHHDVWWHELVGPYMRAPEEYKLFQHLPLLETTLAPYPRVGIVLSTSWVRRYGCAKAAKQLGPRLRQRVIGATFHSRMREDLFTALPRGKQVWDDVQRRKPKDWIALDDDSNGWPSESDNKFIQTHDIDGISHPEVLARLKAALEQLCMK